MKTSNKLLLIATIIMFGYLVVFDFQLRAEYVTGSFKNRFNNMQYIALKNFNAVENNAADVLGVSIEKGPKYGVWIADYLKDKVAISQRINTLYVDYIDKSRVFSRQSDIVIFCPTINTVTTNPIKASGFWYGELTSVSGFTQDEMTILANKATEIDLNKNTIGKLDAGTTASNSKIIINGDNIINGADFNILGKSELKLFNIIKNANYNYTDSATITLNGKSMHQLQHP